MREERYSRLRNPLPWQPKPIPKEKTEEQLEKLITPEHIRHHDTRPEVVKPFSEIKVPRYNRMYGSNKVENSWMYLVDNYASGASSIGSAGTTNIPVALTSAMDVRLSQWPGAIHFYLCIRLFAAFPETVIASVTSLNWVFIDSAGRTIPLTIMPTTGSSMENTAILLPDPITDTSNNNVGTLQTSIVGTAGVVFDWQMGFSYAFMIPALKPYEVIHQEDLLDAHEGHIRNFF